MTDRSYSFSGALLLLSALLSAPLAGQAPTDTAAAVRAADSAEVAWLKLVDQGQVAESWNQAALAFQAAVTSDQWQQAVKNARGPYEPFGTRAQVAARYTTTIPNAPPGQYVITQYRTGVAGGASVIETVVAVQDGKRGWRVSGYFIRPAT